MDDTWVDAERHHADILKGLKRWEKCKLPRPGDWTERMKEDGNVASSFTLSPSKEPLWNLVNQQVQNPLQIIDRDLRPEDIRRESRLFRKTGRAQHEYRRRFSKTLSFGQRAVCPYRDRLKGDWKWAQKFQMVEADIRRMVWLPVLKIYTVNAFPKFVLDLTRSTDSYYGAESEKPKMEAWIWLGFLSDKKPIRQRKPYRYWSRSPQTLAHRNVAN